MKYCLSQVELGKTSVSAEEFVALCEFYQTTQDIVAGIRSDLPTNVYTYNTIENTLCEFSIVMNKPAPYQDE